MRILVIDDVPQIRRIIRRMLREHDVVECSDGMAALEVLNGDDGFDVIFSDMDMAGMNGADFYAALEFRSPLLCSRVVFVTGGGASIAQDKFLRSTARPIVSKPFGVNDLNHAINFVGAEAAHV